jgi:hypothetical protein
VEKAVWRELTRIAKTNLEGMADLMIDLINGSKCSNTIRVSA